MKIPSAQADITKMVGKEIVGKKLRIVVGAYGDMDDCVGLVEDIIHPPEGGTFTKFYGCSYLFKGYPNVRIVELLDAPKDMFSSIPKLIGSMPFWLKVFSLVLFLFLKLTARKFLTRVLGTYVAIAHNPIKKYLFSLRMYCASIGEIYRTLTVVIGRRGKIIKTILLMIRDIGCMALQNDTAYKFRVQDILPEVNVEALKENPIKEIRRVINIFIEREKTKGMDVRWAKLGKMIIFWLRVSPKARRLLVEFFSEIDLEKVKLDEADWYFVLKREQYDFRGISLEERLKIKERIDKEKGHQIPRIRVRQPSQEEALKMKKKNGN